MPAELAASRSESLLRASQLAVFVLALCAILSGACNRADTAADALPNIILIISDDQSWPYYGFMGSDLVQTPNLDRLAAQGVVFTHGFSTASVCRPALNSLLTGLHPIQWEARNEQLERQGVERIPVFGEIDHFETLPKLLARAGYRSFQGGKYWEGSFRQGGFDVGTKTQEQGRFEGMLEALAGGQGLSLGRETMQPLWDFIDAESDAPFFVWYAPLLPHRPHDAPAEYEALYQKKKLHRDARLYFAMISWFDHGVGEILAHLDERKLRNDTLIFFLADNGYEQLPRSGGGILGGLRGKMSIREMGFRTPIIANWPGHIRPDRRSSALTSSVDVFATIADYAGVEIPADRDGRSLRPFLEADVEPSRERIVVGNTDISRLPKYVVEKSKGAGRRYPQPGLDAAGPMQSAYAIRSDRWRYVWFVDADIEELYEIELDPNEMRNVIAEHPQIAAELRSELEAWLEAMRAPYSD